MFGRDPASPFSLQPSSSDTFSFNRTNTHPDMWLVGEKEGLKAVVQGMCRFPGIQPSKSVILHRINNTTKHICFLPAFLPAFC